VGADVEAEAGPAGGAAGHAPAFSAGRPGPGRGRGRPGGFSGLAGSWVRWSMGPKRATIAIDKRWDLLADGQGMEAAEAGEQRRAAAKRRQAGVTASEGAPGHRSPRGVPKVEGRGERPAPLRPQPFLPGDTKSSSTSWWRAPAKALRPGPRPAIISR